MLTLWWWFGISNYELYCENKICWWIDVEKCMRICIMNDVMTLNWCWVLHEICVMNMIYVDELILKNEWYLYCEWKCDNDIM
jgi:hypothetical protein